MCVCVCVRFRSFSFALFSVRCYSIAKKTNTAYGVVWENGKLQYIIDKNTKKDVPTNAESYDEVIKIGPHTKNGPPEIVPTTNLQ